MTNDKWPNKEIQQSLLVLAEHFDNEDRPVRERQLRTWRKMKLYWNSFTNIWYDEVAHDWRIADYSNNDYDDDQGYYDFNVNIFKAYLESIIAALSVTVPAITCTPDDADNNLDIQTAKAGDSIARLIAKHNQDTLLWIHALYIFCTEGLIACYNYEKTDKSYGTYEETHTRNDTEYKYVCPACQQQLDDALMQGVTKPSGLPFQVQSDELARLEADEFNPDGDDAELHAAQDEGLVCPHCASALDPTLEKTPLIVTRIVGKTRKPKSRICLEVYGGLNVKVPNYARSASECPGLRYSYEAHYSKVLELFPHLADEYKNGAPAGLVGIHDPYEAYARLSPQYHGEYPENTSTINLYWFRPWFYNILSEDKRKVLLKEYPDGVYLAKVNECFAGACNEALDDHWTLAKNPLSDYLHFDPLGLLLTSIQDIINELISLILQTIEHGITQTFADPTALNFKKYKQNEVRPGDVYPAATKNGQALSAFFHEIKTANLSPEVIPFYQLVQELGQLTSGAVPSIFGGQLAGSKTASEYSMSRSQALQRLQTPWKMLLVWWKEIFGKAIPAYIQTVVEDERSVERDEHGNFINVFIRKAELEGKIGSIEIDGDENIPITWSQQQEVVMRLLQSGNPVLMETLLSPNNLPWLSKAVGLIGFKIPGEADRDKQFEEIQKLMESEPMPGFDIDPMTGEPIELPSIGVDPDVDNHQIEADICRNWLVSEAGRLAKIERPLGYKNVLLHFKQHVELAQLQMEAAAAVEGTQEGNENPSGVNGSGASKQENENGRGERTTIQ